MAEAIAVEGMIGYYSSCHGVDLLVGYFRLVPDFENAFPVAAVNYVRHCLI